MAVTLNAFRIRNDDGSESTATWRTDEGANGVSAADTSIRIRASIDNSSGASQTFRYRLEYKLVSDASWSAVGTTGAAKLAASANITAGGETTTAQLNAPGGKTTGDFVAGRVWDDENAEDDITIADGKYTEIEWCVTFDSGLIAALDRYQFRVSRLSAAGVGALIQDGVATPEQISLFIDATGIPQSTTVTCRYKVTGAGSWTTGHPFYRVQPGSSATPALGTVDDCFAWVIIDRTPNTSYDIEAIVSTGGTRTLTTSTKALPAAAGLPNKTITSGSSSATIQTALNGLVAGDVLQFDDASYTLDGITLAVTGTVASPIIIRGESRAGVTLTDTTGTIFDLGDCANVIFENFTIVGSGSDSGTAASSIAFESQNSTNTQTNITIRHVTCTGVDRFFGVWLGTGCLIYQCDITGNNEWSVTPTDFLETNTTWNDTGILMAGDGNCAWNNTIKGFGDTFAYAQHSGGNVTGVASNIHYYRNDIFNSCDDPIEVDHAKRNCTWYDNRGTNCINADSIDPLYGGPWISARNILINPYRNRLHKWNGTNSGHFIYNTVSVATAGDWDITPTSGRSAWYQPGGANGDQDYFGYRNNIVVYSGGANDAIWIENAGYSNLDWTKNAWSHDPGSLTFVESYTTIANLNANSPASTPIFSGATNRVTNDVTITSQPFDTAVSLGGNARTEVTTLYVPTVTAGENAKNAGDIIPNITDGYSGSLPDMGAVISGRAIPIYGDRMPSWYPAVGAVVEINSGTTISGVAISAGAADTFPASGDDSDLAAPWSGGALVYVNGLPYLVVCGGGHTDGAWNGYLKLGPLFGAGSDDPKWTIFLASSILDDVLANAVVYSDGRQSAQHTYNCLVGVDTIFYSTACEGGYGGSPVGSGRAFAFTPAEQLPELATNPRTSFAGAAAHHDGKIYYHTGNSGFDELRVYDIAGNSWSSPDAAADQGFDNYVSAACDTKRGGFYLTNGSTGCYWKTSDISRFTGQTAPSGYNQTMLYDPDRDAFVSIQSGSLTVRERSAADAFAGSNPSWTNRTFTGTTPASTVAAGMFGRCAYVPELRGYISVPTSFSHAYFFRSA